MAFSKLHKKICEHHGEIMDWYKGKTSKMAYPIYSSYDIRDAGYKITNVDANIYPAGFNNICPTDQENAHELFINYFKAHYDFDVKKILLVTEEHTNNLYYWQNIASIKKILEDAGISLMIGFPRRMDAPLELTSLHGEKFTVYSAFEDAPEVKKFQPDLIVSNNDFSLELQDWAASVKSPMNPPREIGWYRRKKSNYFVAYNKLVDEFAKLIEEDPFLLRVETELFEHFDITSDESIDKLANQVDAMLAKLKKTYVEKSVQQEPFVFVKNNSGTYGLGVMRVGSGEELRHLNYKNRKKMKAAKGGREIEEVIIQEGVPSIVRSEGITAEPVIYMVGCQLAGGFLRTHHEKDATESLNSPGAVYKRFCVSDLAMGPQKCPYENVYGWSAKLGLLAIAEEGQMMNVKYQSYKMGSC